jgi:uncharacterized membrane protein YgcG
VRWPALTLTLACLPCAAGLAAPRYPELSGWVVDSARALTPAELGELQQIAGQLDREGLAQLAVAVVRPDDLGAASRPEYAVELFRRWKLGHSKQSSDGLLLLFVAGPAGQRGLKVEVGYGLEEVLPDGKVGALMDQFAGPRLGKGEVGAAAVALASALARTVEESARASPPGPGRTRAAEPKRWLDPATAIFLALLPPAATLALLLAFVFAYLRKRVPGKEVTVLVVLAILACLPGFVGLVAANARWLIWVLFLTIALAVLDIALYFELLESKCPRDGRWLARRVRWTALLVEKSCACGYEAVFSFAPGSSRTASGRRASATSTGGWRGGGGGESGGGGADREY